MRLRPCPRLLYLFPVFVLFLTSGNPCIIDLYSVKGRSLSFSLLPPCRDLCKGAPHCWGLDPSYELQYLASLAMRGDTTSSNLFEY